MNSANLAAQDMAAQNVPASLSAIYESYRPFAGVPDEFIAADGTINARWRMLFDRLSEGDLANARAVSERHIRDFGLFYRNAAENQERLWPISELPLLIEEDEWQAISHGLIQRAKILEAMLGDIYGPADLVREGVLPAAIVGGNPEFIRQMHGAHPPGGQWMRIYAADLGRGPDGRWWVLKDRAQAPAGLGYVLENRLATSRAYPLSYTELNVRRIAPFFRAFRNGLMNSATRAQPRICLMTPGRYSPNYSEHSYLARYLGFLLVEGDDLVVHEGALHVKTIAGLKRADVLWRQITAEFLDPMEMNETSRIGVPRLMSLIRNANVLVANTPGAGFIESRALLAFLPNMAEHLNGAPLELPTIATWWCGQDHARDHVLANLDHLMISSAFGRGMAEFGDADVLIPNQMERPERERLIGAIQRRGFDFVAQEIAQLSTMPIMNDGRMEPRPFVLRVYLSATPNGWQVLPGGLCLISDQSGARIVNMTASNHSADVWVLSQSAVGHETLLPHESNVAVRRILGNLPSRAADNLFWFGRYIERAEAILRLVRTLCAKSMEPDIERSEAAETLLRLSNMLAAWGAMPFSLAAGDVRDIAICALGSPDAGGSALATIRAARSVAMAIRERLSIDTWKLINTIDNLLGLDAPNISSTTEALDLCERAMTALAAISGFAQENTNRVAGWRFLEIGRRLERAVDTCRLIRQFACEGASVESLDALLDLMESQTSYRARYLIGPAALPIHDLAFLDPFNPRSIAFQIEQIKNHLSTLPTLHHDGLAEAPMRSISAIYGEMVAMSAEQIDANTVLIFEQKILAFADEIADRYFLQHPDIIKPKTTSGLA